jgi:uncharacterized membrane protein
LHFTRSPPRALTHQGVAAGKTTFGGARVATRASNGARWRMAQWFESRAEIEVPVPLDTCWVLWDDRERIPQWMPWIKR